MKHAAIIIAHDGHEVNYVDVIEYEGEFWLVPHWLEDQVARVQRPLRIIPLAAMEHSRAPGADPEFVLALPLPSTLFGDRIPPDTAQAYRVVELPDIHIPIARDLH
jgi:hypothetical protein